MDLHLRGRRAVVTGASKGIGLGVARGLAAEGVDLVLAARSGELLSGVADELASTHEVKVETVAADLGTAEGIERLVTSTLADGHAVDILINNAGAIPQGSIGELDENLWRDSYELKVWGYVRLAKSFLPGMKERGSGVIVNIIGSAARRSAGGYVAGGFANAGLMNLTGAIANDAGPFGVRCVGINPGLTVTERMDGIIARAAANRGISTEEAAAQMARDIPLRRPGTVHDVADLAVFLASDRASYITGTVIAVDGGATPPL